MNKKIIKSKITRALRKGIKGVKGNIDQLIADDFTQGKAYEAYVLGLICERLKTIEKLDLMLIGGSKISLKSSPGPINYSYPHIQVCRNGAHIANIWTDIEFTTMSAAHSTSGSVSYGEYHEMDVAIVANMASGRVSYEDVYVSVECKHTGYQKKLLREILGIRRELSLLTHPQKTIFEKWPRKEVPADPPSCILVFSTDPKVKRYEAPGDFFGIDFFDEPL